MQSDLYSLGVLLGEVAGDDEPPALCDLIARMTANDPAKRPRSAADALAELDPTRALHPTPPTIALQTKRPVRRSHALAASAALVVLLVVVIVAASSGGGSQQTTITTTTTTTVRLAPAGAPVNSQLDRLEQIVRNARQP